MLENLGLSIAILLAMFGAALLFSGICVASGQNAVLSLFGGAVALATGLITSVLFLRSKLHWRRIQKQNHDRT